jgi:hypothetical protein
MTADIQEEIKFIFSLIEEPVTLWPCVHPVEDVIVWS